MPEKIKTARLTADVPLDLFRALKSKLATKGQSLREWVMDQVRKETANV